jgi:hypothetical protein
MSRINMKQAACIGLSALLAVGMFTGAASAGWGNNNNHNNNNHGYNNNGHNWHNNGYNYRPPPVVYSTPQQYGYYPPPVVYGPQNSLPGVSIQL